MGFALMGLLLGAPAISAGVGAYLPLNLEPDVERQIERVLILADQPILKRPVSLAMLESALPKACTVDARLCEAVQRYLDRYRESAQVTHASAGAALANGAQRLIPNARGLRTRDAWVVSGAGYWQPNDYVRVNLGGIAYQGRAVPAGSYLSVGFSWAQLDLGFRDHATSPATDSSMLLSTEAPTMPSVALSNSTPLTRFGIRYELSLARMSNSDRIVVDGRQSSGHPLRYGMQISVEPVSGWSFGFNRVLQYGGGAMPSSAGFLLHNIFATHNQADVNGEASYVSRFVVPGRTPFAVYFEYAGEDNSDGGSYLLGNAALSAGIDFPRLWRNFDLTFETTEWQNAWYVHSVYLDGMTNDGSVLGHWGGDQRQVGDGVGARTSMLRLGWTAPSGGYWEGRIRTIANQSYSGVEYHHGYDASLRYSRPWRRQTVGAEVSAGRDVFGESWSRLSAFVRYGTFEPVRNGMATNDAIDPPNATSHDIFCDVGLNANRLRIDIGKELPVTSTTLQVAPHLAFGARRAVSQNDDWGVRVELDRIDGHLLIGVRALDYRHRFANPLALGVFAGAARYDVATPAYSIYEGVGAQWRNILPHSDLSFDIRFAQNVARDHLLASDPQGVRPDSFYKITSAALYLSQRF